MTDRLLDIRRTAESARANGLSRCDQTRLAMAEVLRSHPQMTLSEAALVVSVALAG